MVVGKDSKVNGSNNILVGNFDSITGSNNFVFVDSYQSSTNCALLIGKWRVEFDKKRWIKLRPEYAIFFINEE